MEIDTRGNGKMIYFMGEAHTFSIKKIKSKVYSVMDRSKPNPKNSIRLPQGRKPTIAKPIRNQLEISLPFPTRKIKSIDHI